ncbi:uncharacterized protein LOC102351948 [Latimeria chalumnae]|uniref:uncharacterized protein LOC102351948 n=1 Tax=Latimeria chalumnae TaxID=7897 RepID=UPI00313CAE24
MECQRYEKIEMLRVIEPRRGFTGTVVKSKLKPVSAEEKSSFPNHSNSRRAQETDKETMIGMQRLLPCQHDKCNLNRTPSCGSAYSFTIKRHRNQQEAKPLNQDVGFEEPCLQTFTDGKVLFPSGFVRVMPTLLPWNTAPLGRAWLVWKLGYSKNGILGNKKPRLISSLEAGLVSRSLELKLRTTGSDNIKQVSKLASTKVNQFQTNSHCTSELKLLSRASKNQQKI